MLGHDLRNPLNAVSTGAQLLERMPLNERATSIAGLIKDSASRMLGLIENVLDFARGHLGGGLKLERDANEPLEPVLRQVIAELAAAEPGRKIVTEFALAEPVYCDRARIAQLFSNLLGNALAYGSADRPVTIRALCREKYFELSVSNAGAPIPPAAMERLFHPFAHGEVTPSKQGLGLGLYISSEIARAHGGTIDVLSTEELTSFTLKIPLGH